MRHDLPDVYDDRPLRGSQRAPRRGVSALFAALAVVALAAGGWWWLRERREPIVVRQRPAVRVTAPANQNEAVRILRRRLSETNKDECIAIIGSGSDGSSYLFTALNRCENKPLGRWRVNRKTGAVSPK